MGGAFEGICLDYTRPSSRRGLGQFGPRVGSIWGHADFDIDVAGRLLDETFFYGECKWRSMKIDMGMLDLLRKRSDTTSYGRHKPRKQYLLFGRNGCKPEVAELARTDASVHIIGPEELMSAPAALQLLRNPFGIKVETFAPFWL